MIKVIQHEKAGTGSVQLSGDVLFVAGSDLFNPLNQPSQHLPFTLAPHLDRLDLVGYVRFYDGPPASAWRRLVVGFRNVLSHSIQISEVENIKTIKARRLRFPGFLDPLLQDLWMYMILRRHLKNHYDVAIVDGPESATLARILKKTGRVQYLIYYDIDFYPGVHPQWAWILSRREKSLCKTADAVASVSRPLAALRDQQGAKIAVVIPNGVEFDRFNAANHFRIDHPLTLIYAGSLDERWGVDLPIRAIPLLRKQIPDIQLIIAGRGPAEQDLRDLASSLGVSDHVLFKGFVPYAELPNLLAKGDIGMATSRQVDFRKYASPLKLVEYMSAGLPVICSGGGEAEQMIDESGAGMNIPFDPEALTKAVLSMLTTAGGLEAARAKAIQYALGRSWEQMGLLLAQLIARVACNENLPQTVHPVALEKGDL